MALTPQSRKKQMCAHYVQRKLTFQYLGHSLFLESVRAVYNYVC